MTSNEKEREWSTPETQKERNEISFQIDDKSTILHLSTAVDVSTSTLIRIIKDTKASYADDLESLTYPLKNVISFIWSTPMDELFQENLFILFDKILDIAYCTNDTLDEVWPGATHIIESKLSQLTQHILRIIDEVKILSGSEYRIEFHSKLLAINHSIVELTVSLVSFTTLFTSLIRLVIMKDNLVFNRVGSISSLLIIHHYALSSVSCLLSRAVKFIDSLQVKYETGVTYVENIIINYVLDLQKMVVNSPAIISDLFNGIVQRKLSKQLLISVTEMLGEKMVQIIKATTTSLLKIIGKYAPRAFHVLPDLLEEIIVILYQCGHTKLSRLEQFIVYAFDGLLDAVHHISYDLDQNIKSSASTGSFQEPSEPIDMALTNIRISLKLLMRNVKHINDTKDFKANLVASINGLMDLIDALLYPMNVIIFTRKSKGDYSITLVSSLQFIALYVVGLITTSLLAAPKVLLNVSDHNNTYENLSAILSLALINIQLTLDYSKEQSAMNILKNLYRNFDLLFQDLSELDIKKHEIKHTNSAESSTLRELSLVRKSF